jgi:uncharacterized protein YcbX
VAIVIDSLLWTPVKATVIHQPSELELTPFGLPDDRRFVFLEARGGQCRTGPGLLVIESAWDPGTRRLALTLPDGRTAEAVVQVDLPDPIDPAYPYAMVRGPFSELVSDHLGRPVRLAMSLQESHAVDVEPVTLLSLASIKVIEQHLGQPLGHERFRMSINLAGAEPFEEDSWYGERISVGSAVLRVIGPVARCAVTTYEPRTGRRDASTLKTLIQQRAAIAFPTSGEMVKAPFGVYARVEVPGRIVRGQSVRVLSGQYARPRS